MLNQVPSTWSFLRPLPVGTWQSPQVLMRESLIETVNLHNLREQLACLVGMAACALVEKDWEKAVRLCALADIHKRENTFQFQGPDESACEVILKECRKKLGKSRYVNSYKQAEALDLSATLASLMKAQG